MHYTQPDVYEFISKQTNDSIIKWKTCRISGTKFPIYQSDLDFYEKMSSTFAGETFQIPTPTLCPEERQRRRLARRNERKLYRNTCMLSNEPVISFVSPEKPYPVMKRELWFSDAYDPLKYGREFDFSRTFGEQYKELLDVVPRFSVQQQNPMENSGYCNCASNCKNCYYLFDSDYCEASYYSNVLKHSDHCMDCSVVSNAEVCYACVNCTKCYGCRHCTYCIDCSESWWLLDCIQCTNCFGCVNMRNASYCIYNKQYTKEEYQEMLPNLLSHPDVEQKTTDFLNKQPRRAVYTAQLEKSAGHNMIEAKKSTFCYDVGNIDECSYCDFVYRAENCQDISSVGESLSWAYDSVSVGIGATRVLFSSSVVVDSSDILYSYMCFPMVKHCFGCVGMKNNSYCIFNKQYTPEEYEQMVAKIIKHMQTTGEWGEFFDMSLSPFGYNETVAQEFFPLSLQEAKVKGCARMEHNYDTKVPAGAKVLQKDEIPSVDEATDEICSQIIECSRSSRPFRLTTQELAYYKKHRVPLPHLHPDERHQLRRERTGERCFYLRDCAKTGEKVLSVYHPDEPYIVYSEEAYNMMTY